MTPYYEHSGITIYHGNCMDVLPQLPKVGLVLTDPPYGIEGLVGGYGREGRNIEGDKNLIACHDSLSQCVKLCDNGWILCFYSCRVTPEFFAGIDKGLKYFGELIWDKRAPGMGGALRYQHENIAIFKIGEAQALEPEFSILSYYRQGIDHPHEKPLGLMTALITFAGAGDGIILDPFMGSGTTMRAAKDLNRKAIGIEIDERYCEIAAQRLRQEVFDF